jgi:hypothetical protein
LICGISKMLLYLKEYLEVFIWIRSWRQTGLTIFHTFILSKFNFCPLAWHFCTNKNSKKLEKVQERALRFVYEDYNSSAGELWYSWRVNSLCSTSGTRTCSGIWCSSLRTHN